MDKPDHHFPFHPDSPPPTPDPAKNFAYQSETGVPHHSGDTPGVGASLTDGDWNVDARPAPAAGNWNSPDTVDIGLTHAHPTFGRK